MVKTTSTSHVDLYESSNAKENVGDLTKEEEQFIEQEYQSGKFSPKDVWELRDTKNLNAYEKRIVYYDDKVIEQLRLDKMRRDGLMTPSDLYARGLKLKQQHPHDPYGDLPECNPLRDGGDPREDVFCLTKEERKQLSGNNYGYTVDEHPELEFLEPYLDDAFPPNQTTAFYTSHTSDGVPKRDAMKFVARFYGTFEDDPFTTESLHAHQGTKKEREIRHPMEYKNLQEKWRKLEADRREVINEEGNVPGKHNFMEGVDPAELDKFRTREDGTDTFRDAIAIHDAPHSVALFIDQMEREKHRDPAERNRQFALFNVVGLSFPWGLEYVKYYTQEGDDTKLSGEFPLVVTSLTQSADQMLEDNGLPKAMARWCTSNYKLKTSENFFKTYDLEGLTQIIGMTRFHGNRLQHNPFPVIWERVKQDRNYHIKGDDDEPPELPDADEEGFPFEYDVKYNEKFSGGEGAWRVKSIGPHPDFRIYQVLPLFDTTEDWQVNKMAEYKVNINPIITNFDFHGCLLCPNRGPEYFQCLKDRNRELYDIADNMRKSGSMRKTKRGEGEYWYHYDPTKGSMEEQAEKYPNKFTRDDLGNLRPIM